MDYSKKTKIVCTIGPSSWDPAVIKKMIENGMNCARVNGAFADEAELDKVTKLIKDVSNEVGLMMDVKGPEVRMNKFPETKKITPGMEIIIGNTSDDEIYPGNYSDLYKQIKPGQRIVIGDGDTELEVIEIREDKMITKVNYGEFLKPGKALNFPGGSYTSETLTEKDITNLKHSIKLGWDFVSASFIQNAESAKTIRKYLEGSNMKLIAKIEDSEGVKNIDEILKEVDGIMVARGGLGVELGLEKVPMVQRLLIEKSIQAGKPVITATQMLESMTYNPRPTRAEVNDVATAIMLGSDSVMLSGESSAGEYPAETVEFMTKIAREVEPTLPPVIVEEHTGGPLATDALTKAVAEMAIEMDNQVDVVIVVTKTGRTARSICRHGIKQPVFAFVSDEEHVRELSISRGINRAFALKEVEEDRDEALKSVLSKGLELGIIKSGQNVLFVSKTPVGGEEFFPNIFEVVKVQ